MITPALGEASQLERQILKLLAETLLLRESPGNLGSARQVAITVKVMDVYGLPVVGLEDNNFSVTQDSDLSSVMQIIPVVSVTCLNELGTYRIDIDVHDLSDFNAQKSFLVLHVCHTVVKNSLLQVSRVSCTVTSNSFF